VGAEVLDERLRGAEAERERPLAAGEPVDRVAEQRAQVRLRAPEERRGDARDGRHVAGDDLQHLADEPVRGPGGEPDPAAGAADAGHLRGGLLVVRREHRAEHRQDRVEARVRERDRLRVALDELDAHALGLDAAPAAREQPRDVVDADDVAAGAGSRDRRVAAAGGDVQDAPVGPQVDGLGEGLRNRLDEGGDGVEVAARPHLLLALLDRSQVGGGCLYCRHLVLLRGRVTQG
jgi:hypothetical protein